MSLPPLRLTVFKCCIVHLLLYYVCLYVAKGISSLLILIKNFGFALNLSMPLTKNIIICELRWTI